MVSRKLEKWILKRVRSKTIWACFALSLAILFIYPVVLHRKFIDEFRSQELLGHSVDDLISSNYKIGLLILDDAFDLKSHKSTEFDEEILLLTKRMQVLADLPAAKVVPKTMLAHLKAACDSRIEAAKKTLPIIKGSYSQASPSVIAASLANDRDVSRRFVLQAIEFKRAVSTIVDLNSQEKRLYSIDILLRLSVALCLVGFYLLYRYQAHLFKRLHSVRAQLKRSRSELRSALRAKEQFLALISHHIRTPLNKSKGALELLHRTELAKEQRELVTSGTIAIKTVSSILSVMFNDSGAQTIDGGSMREFSLREFARDFGAIFAVTTLGESCLIEFKMATHRDDRLYGNYELLMNYIMTQVGMVANKANSSKILIEISVRESSSRKLIVEFEMRSIEEHKEPRSVRTELFPVSEKILSNSSVGLALILSRDSGDALFTDIEFDLAEDSQPHKAPTQGQLRVLAVDDDSMNLMIATEALAKEGFAPTRALSATEAFAIMDRCLVDAILMDLRMPEIDGLSAVEMIRRGNCGAAYKNVPVIMLTANSAEVDRERALAAGASAYVEKPFDQSSLAVIIRNQDRKNCSLDSMALVRVEKIAGYGNPGLIAELYTLALEEIAKQMKVLQSALSTQATNDVKASAHKLRSVAANVGAIRLEHLLKILDAGSPLDSYASISAQLDREWERIKPLLERVIEQHRPLDSSLKQ